MLSAEQVYYTTTGMQDGDTKYYRHQRSCPECGEPKPFDLAAQVETGGMISPYSILVGAAVVAGFFILIYEYF